MGRTLYLEVIYVLYMYMCIVVTTTIKLHVFVSSCICIPCFFASVSVVSVCVKIQFYCCVYLDLHIYMNIFCMYMY